MKNFNDLEWTPHTNGYAGFLSRARLIFDNGYGISVVTGDAAYTDEDNPYEVAVLDEHGELVYDTGITQDVIGYLNEEAVDALMYEIQELEDTKPPVNGE